MFCGFCGSTYDVKLCSRNHPNSRYAEFCSQCGSREMSSPQPKIPLFIRPLLAFTLALPKLLSVVLVIGVAVLLLWGLAADRNVQQLLLILALVVVPPILAWRWLPSFAKKIFRGIFKFAARLCFSPRKATGRRR